MLISRPTCSSRSGGRRRAPGCLKLRRRLSPTRFRIGSSAKSATSALVPIRLYGPSTATGPIASSAMRHSEISMTETRLSTVGLVVPAERPSPKPSERLAAWIQFPREHGAWGMLLFPFISAMVLTGSWSWSFIPASFAALAVFLIREPLTVLARQEYVWTNEHPEAGVARRSAHMLSIVLLLSGIWLLRAVPLGWMAFLALATGAMTAAYVFAVVRNRQRSVLFQIIGAVTLCGSAFLGYLAGGRSPG